jgi:hypothetical protein
MAGLGQYLDHGDVDDRVDAVHSKSRPHGRLRMTSGDVPGMAVTVCRSSRAAGSNGRSRRTQAEAWVLPYRGR